MPQMAPLNWLSLYVFFYLLFLTSIIFNYYMFLYTPKSFKTKKIETTINWKW